MAATGRATPRAPTGGRELARAAEDVVRHVAVVVVRAGPGLVGREQAGVVWGRRDDADAARLAQREQVVERRLLEERVAPGDHHEVEVAFAHGARRGIRVVRADADRTDKPLVAEAGECGQALGEPLVEVVRVGVVQVGDVDAVEAQSLERVLDAASHAGLGRVEAAHEPVRHREAVGEVVAADEVGIRLQHAPHLG